MLNKPKAILFDLDDTLIDTYALFDMRVKEAVAVISTSLKETDYSKLLTDFNSINSKVFPSYKVNAKRWGYALRILSKSYTISPAVSRQAIETIFSVYKTIPDLHENSIETLSALKDYGYRLGLVTHATVRWTNRKVAVLKLRNFFEMVDIASVNNYKNAQVWSSAINKLELNPNDVAVVGDNLSGDIIAAYQAGVRQLYWLDRGKGWSLYRKGDLPEGTVRISNLQEISNALCSK